MIFVEDYGGDLARLILDRDEDVDRRWHNYYLCGDCIHSFRDRQILRCSITYSIGVLWMENCPMERWRK